jgi:hypothetical protein
MVRRPGKAHRRKAKSSNGRKSLRKRGGRRVAKAAKPEARKAPARKAKARKGQVSERGKPRKVAPRFTPAPALPIPLGITNPGTMVGPGTEEEM